MREYIVFAVQEPCHILQFCHAIFNNCLTLADVLVGVRTAVDLRVGSRDGQDQI